MSLFFFPIRRCGCRTLRGVRRVRESDVDDASLMLSLILCQEVASLLNVASQPPPKTTSRNDKRSKYCLLRHCESAPCEQCAECATQPMRLFGTLFVLRYETFVRMG